MEYAKVIYVDDDVDDRDIMKELLNEHNFHNASYFQNGHDVLDFLNKIKDDSHLPELIVTDINMPNMSGIELLTRLKANDRYRSIKVIMLSTANRQDYLLVCKRLGAYEYFQKPATYIEMKSLAKHIIA